jgi:hypothetical protein
MRFRLKKFVVSMLCVVLVSGIFIPYSKKVSAINNVWIEVFPRKVGLKATYKIHFSLEKTLAVHQYIKLVWPKGTTLPPLPEDETKRKEELKRIIEAMSIGLSPCSACQGLPIIDYNENSLKFNSHIELDPSKEGYKDITVTVPDVVGVQNPTVEGKYIFKISTQTEPTAVASAPYDIVESKIGVPEGMPVVTVVPPSYKANAAYTVGFNVGRGGWLKEGDARVRVRFPEGTVFSKIDIPANSISINGTPLTASPSVSKTAMTMICPVGIKDSGRLEIVFNERAGILNPSKPGDYKLEVSTMPADPEWVASNTYKIEKGGAILRVVPAKVNKAAEYSFAFIMDEGMNLNPGDRVMVKFPEGTTIPKAIDKSTVFINDTTVSNVSIKDLELSLYSPVTLKTGDTVDIKIEASAGIVNPAKPGDIKLGYKLQSSTDYLYTLSIKLVESKLEVKEVIVEPNNANSPATYTIPLLLGDNGALKAGDFIAVNFPPNVTIPAAISNQTIKINTEIVKSVQIAGKTIKAILTSEIAGGSEIKLTIDKEAQIKNPDTPKADYLLSVFTSSEDAPVNSDPFNITPSLPETKISINGGVMGRNNWYTELPLIGFTCSDPNASIYIYWDNKVEQKIKYDGSPKAPDPGQFESKLYYWAESVFGVEVLKEAIIKVDMVNPEMVIESPAEAKVLTQSKEFLVKGRTTQIKTIRFGTDVLEYDKIAFINGKNVPVSETDGSFSLTVPLQQGDNKVTVRTEDDAGRFTVKDFLIVSDSTAPVIDVTNPIPNSVVVTKNIKITGKTDDPTAQLLINGEVAYVEADGTFAFDLTLKQIGLVKVLLEATDPIGNINKKEIEFWFGYTVVLQIGNKVGKTNGVEKTMNVAPFIQKGKTLVPFRFIGEQLNAKIDFSQDPKTKFVKDVMYELGTVKIKLTIGASDAIVNGSKVKLDVPAQIVKGSTVVPLRFVTESLGCALGWEPKAQIITITYPKI